MKMNMDHLCCEARKRELEFFSLGKRRSPEATHRRRGTSLHSLDLSCWAIVIESQPVSAVFIDVSLTSVPGA